jgi:hypothetical protein
MHVTAILKIFPRLPPWNDNSRLLLLVSRYRSWRMGGQCHLYTYIDKLVDIAIRLGAGRLLWFSSRRRQRLFSSQKPPAGSVPHPTSYSVITSNYFPGVMRLRRGLTAHLHLVLRLQFTGLHRESFTFTLISCGRRTDPVPACVLTVLILMLNTVHVLTTVW